MASKLNVVARAEFVLACHNYLMANGWFETDRIHVYRAPLALDAYGITAYKLMEAIVAQNALDSLKAGG